jgi:hypothetical protein
MDKVESCSTDPEFLENESILDKASVFLQDQLLLEDGPIASVFLLEDGLIASVYLLEDGLIVSVYLLEDGLVITIVVELTVILEDECLILCLKDNKLSVECLEQDYRCPVLDDKLSLGENCLEQDYRCLVLLIFCL